jgi:hypothetical protein
MLGWNSQLGDLISYDQFLLNLNFIVFLYPNLSVATMEHHEVPAGWGIIA